MCFDHFDLNAAFVQNASFSPIYQRALLSSQFPQPRRAHPHSPHSSHKTHASRLSHAGFVPPLTFSAIFPSSRHTPRGMLHRAEVLVRRRGGGGRRRRACDEEIALGHRLPAKTGRGGASARGGVSVGGGGRRGAHFRGGAYLEGECVVGEERWVGGALEAHRSGGVGRRGRWIVSRVKAEKQCGSKEPRTKKGGQRIESRHCNMTSCATWPHESNLYSICVEFIGLIRQRSKYCSVYVSDLDRCTRGSILRLLYF